MQTVGCIRFDHRVETKVAIQEVLDDAHKRSLRVLLSKARHGPSGGTSMYQALQYVLRHFTSQQEKSDNETWIVCLTDGDSHDTGALIYDELQHTSPNLHLIVIGVNLQKQLHKQLEDLCNKYCTDGSLNTKGFFVPTENEISALNTTFAHVASRIPVSSTFELDGEVTDEECHRLMGIFLPSFIPADDMLRRSFWSIFLFRRISVLDKNQDFNYNETYDNLGRSILKNMLSEVEQFLSTEQNLSWTERNHCQLIYDFTNKNSPEFRLICTAPDFIDAETRAAYESLNLPGFFIPEMSDLKKLSTLFRYLSQALGVPLTNLEDGSQVIASIIQSKFVLTLDFTVKLLCYHERIACGIPCVVEGETGVSKTALTKMYCILMNSALQARADSDTLACLHKIRNVLSERFPSSCESNASVHDRLQEILSNASSGTIDNCTEVARVLYGLLQAACASRDVIFQAPPPCSSKGPDGDTDVVSEFLTWFSKAVLEPTFFEINVHAKLSEHDVLERFKEIRDSARKLIGSEALVIVFLDEVNTSSCLGLFKEIIIDRSICGNPFEPNIIVVAACNPARRQATTCGGTNLREHDLGKVWASGHYQVADLPGSISLLKWDYGSLNSTKEKEFIFRRLQLLDDCIPSFLVESLTELISTSQESVRTFAAKNIQQALMRVCPDTATDEDAMIRAKSVVSLRDIQRVFNLFHFFTHEFTIVIGTVGTEQQRYRRAMLLAIAVVYYLRLDTESREKFLDLIEALPTQRHESERLIDVLQSAMTTVAEGTAIPDGIAMTRGLKENIFTVLTLTLSFIPLMIVGPPGSSKTLSVNMVSDNSNGEDSPSPFYRKLARLSTFHYQCTKKSDSQEVGRVFKMCTERQSKVDPAKHKCLVFMDEAGLPEEEKESLKIMHYFLEGHMSTKSEVGFVGVTNHPLDAAKSNRCVSLLRQEPDREEMSSIANDILFGGNVDGNRDVRLVRCNGVAMKLDEFANSLCHSYSQLSHNKEENFSWFQTFFGLRDFIYLLKAIRNKSNIGDMIMHTSSEILLHALERNFNGVYSERFEAIVDMFLSDLCADRNIKECIRPPMVVVQEALLSNKNSIGISSKPRYKLIIDETEDDSIMRLFQIEGFLDTSSNKLFKLSNMPEDAELEQISYVSGVKFAALQGQTAVQSNAETVHECFYDLYNQNFRSLQNRDGTTSYYANIAIGGISRLSLVHPKFECIVHTKLSELPQLPAPFLNRFEKYRLNIRDVLLNGWGKQPRGTSVLLQNARSNVALLPLALGGNGLLGWVPNQTLDSIFVDLLPRMKKEDKSSTMRDNHGDDPASFIDFLLVFLEHNTSLEAEAIKPDVQYALEAGQSFLPIEDADVMEQLMCGAEFNQASLAHTFDEMLAGDSSSSTAKVATAVVEMTVTRIAMLRLLRLARPESIFANR